MRPFRLGDRVKLVQAHECLGGLVLPAGAEMVIVTLSGFSHTLAIGESVEHPGNMLWLRAEDVRFV